MELVDTHGTYIHSVGWHKGNLLESTTLSNSRNITSKWILFVLHSLTGANDYVLICP